MKRKTLTARERAHYLYQWLCDTDWVGCWRAKVSGEEFQLKAMQMFRRHSRAAVRAALRKRQRQIKALEIEQVNHIEIIERNAEARIDAARAEGMALRKRRGTR